MDNSTDNQTYWKSLEEWRQDPEIANLAETEFLSSPISEDGTLEPTDHGSPARREFLKLMGASIALSSTACLRRPVQKIVPYVNRPEEIVPGVANYYTSVWQDGAQGFGILVKTREGRPIKVQGNPNHPVNGQGLTARANAHLLGLYDPDRLRGPQRNLHNEGRTNHDTVQVSWDELDRGAVEQLKKGSVAVLTSSLASPSTNALIAQFAKVFNGRHYTWDAIASDDVYAGQLQSYGQGVLPRYRFESSQLTVSIDADFLGTYLSPSEFAQGFAKTHKPGPEMSQLVVFESIMSLTGSNADIRYRIRPSQQLDVAMALLYSLLVRKGVSAYASDTQVKGVLTSFTQAFASLGVAQSAIDQLADRLWEKRGQSLVIAGGITTRTKQSVDLQVAVNFLNTVLENDGKTIDHSQSPVLTQGGSHQDLQDLITRLNSGEVTALITYGVNPGYALPESAGLAQALRKVKLHIHCGDYDETGRWADYVAPIHHSLENWGDAEFQKGVVSLQQPTVRPLHNTRAFEDNLIQWLKGAGQNIAGDNWYGYLRQRWQAELGTLGFDSKWDEALQKGFVLKTNREVTGSARAFKREAFAKIQHSAQSSEWELALYSKVAIGDGSMANNSWLQELPDPVTKIVWDNYLCISPAAAKKMSIKEGDMVRLAVGEKSVDVPVHVQVGAHDNVVALAVGYGRTHAGKVGTGIGVNAIALVQFAGLATAYSGLPAKIEKLNKRYELANTGGHHTMMGRAIAAETTLGEFLQNPSSGVMKPHFTGTIWPEHKYPNHKWGMAIDVNSCTGCSACVVACQSENNVPVVGKKFILQGREMHWLRIDRYHSEDPENPETLHQAMLCQHCDNAPCETVCPVVATTHSEDGLNTMTYNRCVGTRYCANNCPYKVRRFNWFNNIKTVRAPQEMALNPEVGVRSRGVMEKCSFCVQRIKEVKNTAKDRGEKVNSNDIKTACQDSCPTSAIVFGDYNDPNSHLNQVLKANQARSYEVLAELNNKSAIRYLTKVRNRPAVKNDKEGHHHG